jgi:hypothetical protein
MCANFRHAASADGSEPETGVDDNPPPGGRVRDAAFAGLRCQAP